MSDKLTFTNTAIQRAKGALAILGNRRMANIGSDLKVAKLLRLVSPHTEEIEKQKREAALQLVSAIPEGTELSPFQEQVLGMRVAEAQAKVDLFADEVEKTVEIEVPVGCYLKEADLPKELSGKEGAANAAQLGAIVADLGPLFVFGEDEG